MSPTLDLMFCCHHHEILNSFAFELVFRKSNPKVQWSMGMSGGNMHGASIHPKSSGSGAR